MIKYNLVNALAIDNINLLKVLKDTDTVRWFFFVCITFLQWDFDIWVTL